MGIWEFFNLHVTSYFFTLVALTITVCCIAVALGTALEAWAKRKG